MSAKITCREGTGTSLGETMGEVWARVHGTLTLCFRQASQATSTCFARTRGLLTTGRGRLTNDGTELELEPAPEPEPEPELEEDAAEVPAG